MFKDSIYYYLFNLLSSLQRPVALANSVWFVFPASSDRLPLQARNKLCRVVWLTDRIKAVMMVKRLT